MGTFNGISADKYRGKNDLLGGTGLGNIFQAQHAEMFHALFLENWKERKQALLQTRNIKEIQNKEW